MIRYGSVCSGIEAATVAWHPLGWRPAFYSEIDKFPRAVLSHHYPDVPLHGDFTSIRGDEYGPIDALVGGTPCQSFSIAGLRGGLGDARGNLALAFLQLARRARPRWLVWENVPGVLSSNGGRDFGSILGGMVELGYGYSYRVLDAQYFGVAQRRRRVFVVGHLGDWRRAAAVLLERESLRWDSPPRREARGGSAIGALGGTSPGGGWRFGADEAAAGQLIAGTLNANGKAAGSATQQDAECGMLVTHSLRADGFDASEDGTGRGTPLVPVCFSSKDHGADAERDLSPTLRAGGHAGSHPNAGVPPAIAYAIQERAVSENLENGPQGKGYQPETGYTLEARNKVQAVAFAQNSRDELREMPYVGALAADAGMKQTSYIRSGSAVRRLTPRECERLQGFPDDYTLIPYRNGMAADGPRYKALGNSMAVPVMAWIGRRIAMVDGITKQEAA